jgi:ABC-2 type transport system ATP-binding protein
VCAYQPQSQIPINGVTPRQAIELVGRIRAGEIFVVQKNTSNLLRSLELEEWSDIAGHQLSGGVRRLTAFCMAAVIPGKLLILDEPTNDVDPLRRRLLWKEVRRIAEGGAAVMLVTHNVLEAEKSVDKLAVINEGRVVTTGTPGALKAAGTNRLRLELTLEPGAELPPLPKSISQPTAIGSRLIAAVSAEDLNPTIAWLKEDTNAAFIEEFSIASPTLEDVYLRYIGRNDALINDNQEVKNELSMVVA